MNVHLTAEMKKLIEAEVASGRYASASEVIREGLRLFLEEHRWREEVRQKIAEGLAQARAGELLDGEEVARSLRNRVSSPRHDTE